MTKHLKEKPARRVLGIIYREVADPGLKARILVRLEEDELTYELGVETAEAGIHFDEWPYRCLRAKDFRRGFMSAVTLVAHPELTISKDGSINTKVN